MRPSHKTFSAGVLDSSRAVLLQTPKPLFQEHPNPVLRLLPFTEVIPIRPLLFIPKKGKGISMSTKLYVGNLAFQTTSQELQELFASAGTVESAAVVDDRDTGRSRGFGFVEMSTKEEGAAAISQFNGKEVNGRALNVNEAKPRENRSGGGGGRGGFGRGGGARGGFGANSGGGGGYGQKREPRW